MDKNFARFIIVQSMSKFIFDVAALCVVAFAVKEQYGDNYAFMVLGAGFILIRRF